MPGGRLGGFDLRRMVAFATGCLERHRAEVDRLNVYPVPDGDTGTNLLLTLRSAQAHVEKVDASSLSEVSEALAEGSLLGARGNSGVILSQIFRGLARTFQGKREADGLEFGMALYEGVQSAYRAVVKPVEGTILTVAREAARKAVEMGRRGKDVVAVLREAWAAARESLARTPEFLPILKRAGVVDAGGQGFVYILEGLVVALVGEEGSALLTDYQSTYQTVVRTEPEPELQLQSQPESEPGLLLQPQSQAGDSWRLYPYDLVALVRVRGGADARLLRDRLGEWGESLLVVGEDPLVKVHIHTARPDRVLALLMDEGDLAEAQVEDMRLGEERWRTVQGGTGAADARLSAADAGIGTADAGIRLGVVAVVPGPGWARLMASLGATVVDGGPTMNPSTRDLLQAVTAAEGKRVLVLANHVNAVAAARQMAAISPVPVDVVASPSPCHGLAALIAFNPDGDGAEVRKAMEAAMRGIRTGQVVRAVRDFTWEGQPIREGDALGLMDDTPVVVHPSPEGALLKLLELLVTEDVAVVSVFCGTGVGAEERTALAVRLAEKYPGLQVEVHDGGQPLQEYMVAVER